MKVSSTTVMQRCDTLAGISEESGCITRPYGSRSMRQVNELVAGWMREAGMEVKTDGIGNLIGRYAGETEATMIVGSHLDTVRDAGRYDGILGVMTALAAVERLDERGERLPFSVEVVAFADEEGLRFGTTYLGSSAYAGAFDASRLELKDAGGVNVEEAVREFGGDPEALRKGRNGESLLGYCEVHIEQGPVLESKGLSVGVVSAIAGQSRVSLEFTGEAGHAGTVPMRGRKDALCAAAEFTLAVNEVALAEPGAVATVGELSVSPGVSNVIPGGARLSLDLRHQDDAVRERLRDELQRRAETIARERNVECEWHLRQQTPAVPMSEELTGLLCNAVEQQGLPVQHLQSGAGHDAAQMAALTQPAMLFVRCGGGISHNPAESITEDDAGVAVETVYRFLKLAAEREAG